MRFTRTVCSIIAGVLILSHTPAVMAIQLDTFKKVMGYALFLGTCTIIGMSSKWFYETFISTPQCKPQFDAMDEQVKTCSTVLQNAGIHAKAHSMEIERQKEHLRLITINQQGAHQAVQQLSQTTQNIDKGVSQMMPIATSIIKQQGQTSNALKEADVALQKRADHIGITARLFSRLTEQHKQHFRARMEAMKCAQGDLSNANTDLAQAKISLQRREQIILATEKTIQEKCNEICDVLNNQPHNQKDEQPHRSYKLPIPKIGDVWRKSSISQRCSPVLGLPIAVK